MRAVVLLLCVVGITTTAWGKSAPTAREIEEHACYNDAMTLCGEFVPDETKITACMEQKKAQLSPPCAAMFKPDK